MNGSSNDKDKLFKKRWDRFRKLGAYKYGLFLALMYSVTVVLVSLLWDFREADIPFSEITTLIDKDLIIKTVTFFAFGLIFGVYHYNKSEKKYKDGI